MRRILATTIVCAFALSAISCAVEAQKSELAKELLDAMDMQKTIEKSFEMVKQMIPSQMKLLGVPDDAYSDKEKSEMQKMMDLVMKEMSWDKLKEDYISIYAETYTEEELKAAIEFYKTPLGQKFIKKQPEILIKSMEISQRQMATLMPKIQQIIQEMMEQ